MSSEVIDFIISGLGSTQCWPFQSNTLMFARTSFTMNISALLNLSMKKLLRTFLQLLINDYFETIIPLTFHEDCDQEGSVLNIPGKS